MSPPCSLETEEPDADLAATGVQEVWRVRHGKTGDVLIIRIHERIVDETVELGQDPGLVKDGVEADLQRLLAEQIELLGDGHRLVRREDITALRPVALLGTGSFGAST